MKNEYKVWRAHGSYFLKSFPNQNVTIVWDDVNKTYAYYKGIINKKEENVIKSVNVKKQATVKQESGIWKTLTLIAFGACVGVISLILLLVFAGPK